jgi:hypothetical protein
MSMEVIELDGITPAGIRDQASAGRQREGEQLIF